MPIIDMHLHSNYSDGESTPLALVETAVKAGLALFSITDHNDMTPETRQVSRASQDRGILFVEGIEVSAIDRATGWSLHVLGYAKCFNYAYLEERLKQTIIGYQRRARGIIYKLNLEYPGLQLDFDSLAEERRRAFLSRNEIAHLLRIYLGNRISHREALRQAYIPEDSSWMMSVEEACNIICQAGGLPVLAHAGALSIKEGFNNSIRRWVSSGLSGLEVYHPRHDHATIFRLNRLAQAYGLLITVGSDWHGSAYTPGILPSCVVGDEDLATIKHALI